MIRMKWRKYLTSKTSFFVFWLLLFSLFGVVLNIVRMIATDSYRLGFLPWNLLLAWLPLIFAWLLYQNTSKFGLVWSKKNAVLFTLWLLFLPNAFYIITDYIHLADSRPENLVFDVALITTYMFVGVILGVTSLLLVHDRALKRFGRNAHWLPMGVILASGFAIYLGRYLRWNSWDIIFNPLGLLYDVSDRVVNPTEHSLTFVTTLLFFALLSLLYWSVWSARNLVGKK